MQKVQRKRYWAFGLWFLFITYMSGLVLFSHSHVVNGTTIVHSHPFKKNTTHQHTTAEYQLLDLLCQVTITDASIPPTYCFCGDVLLQVLDIKPLPAFTFQRTFQSYSLRAPPTILYA